jgi:hypothetical protein
MSKVILDDALRTKLNGLTETVEVCEPTGRVLGFFVPRDEYLKDLYAKARTAVTDEEIERLRQQTGGRSLKEILKDLEGA